MNMIAISLLNTARQKYGQRWFDGDDLIAPYHEAAASHLKWLVDRGYLERKGFMLRIKKDRR